MFKLNAMASKWTSLCHVFVFFHCWTDIPFALWTLRRQFKCPNQFAASQTHSVFVANLDLWTVRCLGIVLRVFLFLLHFSNKWHSLFETIEAFNFVSFFTFHVRLCALSSNFATIVHAIFWRRSVLIPFYLVVILIEIEIIHLII